jgi:hypothetical protein
MIQIRARVLRAPITMPGKKPAANDLPSKPCFVWRGAIAEQSEVWDAEAGLVEEGVAFAVDVADGDGDGDGEVSLAHIVP